MQSELCPIARRASSRRAWIIGGLLLGLLPGLGLAGEATFRLLPPLFPDLSVAPGPDGDLAARDSTSSEEPATNSGSEGKPVAAPRPPLFDKWTTVVFLGSSFVAT